jgi:hypothetical protein
VSRLRCGVRVAAATIGLIAAGYGGYVLDRGGSQFTEVMEGLTFILVVAGIWVIVEAIVGGFEQVRKTTQDRYDQLEAKHASACAIAAQTVLAIAREREQQDGAEAEVRHLYR